MARAAVWALLLLAVLAASGTARVAAAAQPAEEAAEQRQGRRLLQCMVLESPRYKYTAGAGRTEIYPLCATQHVQGAWVNAEASASWAVAIHNNPEAPRPDEDMECQGEVNAATTVCWGGDAFYSGPTFDRVNCCVRLLAPPGR